MKQIDICRCIQSAADEHCDRDTTNVDYACRAVRCRRTFSIFSAHVLIIKLTLENLISNISSQLIEHLYEIPQIRDFVNELGSDRKFSNEPSFQTS